MKLNRSIMNVLVSTAFGTTLLFAQGPPPGNPPNAGGGNPPNPAAMVSRRVARLTTLLNLTEAQQQQATTIFTDAATKATALRPGLRTARNDLKTAIQQNNINGINQAATTIGNLMTQLTMIEGLSQAAFYAILTPDQQTKLNQLESQRGGFFRGGPGGPPPGMGPKMGRGPH